MVKHGLKSATGVQKRLFLAGEIRRPRKGLSSALKELDWQRVENIQHVHCDMVQRNAQEINTLVGSTDNGGMNMGGGRGYMGNLCDFLGFATNLKLL